MIYGLDRFAAIGMGSEGTTPSPNGNHLRWGFAGDLPFPADGFSVYRRFVRSCLDFRGERLGRSYTGNFSIRTFTFWSGETVAVVESLPPAIPSGLPPRSLPQANWPGLSLPDVRAFRVQLPVLASEVTLRVVVASRLMARAYAGSVLVDQGVLQPGGGVQDLSLSGQGIDRVIIDAVEAILVRVCCSRPPRPREELNLKDWDFIAGPLKLPQSFAEGAERILLNPDDIESAYLKWMGYAIQVCLDVADPVASALRMLQFLEGTGIVPTGTPSPTGGQATFSVKAQSLLLLAAIDPSVARFLGLGFVDQSAPVGETFDYLLLGHWSPEERYCFVPELTRGPAPALAPPASVTASAFPVGGSSMAVGVSWTLPLTDSGSLLTTAALTYDVRATLAAPAAQASQPSASSLSFPAAPANGDDRILPARRRTASGPGDYPAHLFTHFNCPEGWWAYEATGRDIFGRGSIWSPPTFVRVLDIIPPPAPTTLLDPQPGPGVPPEDVVAFPIRARYLSVGDPDLDAADLALLDDSAGPVTLVEWNWLPDQAQLAPDVHEFRVYFHPRFGSEAVTVVNVGAPSSTAVNVTLGTAPAFNSTGGELTSQGQSFTVLSQTGVDLAVVPNRIGKSDGTFEIGLPSPGLAQLDEGWRSPRNWEARSHVVSVAVTPAGYYRAVIPGELLTPTSAQPLATGWIGVTAADNKAHTPDDAARTGAWAGRPGNESGIALRQQIHAVHRAPPPKGPEPTIPQYATRADFYGRSRCRVTFSVTPPASYHIWRAVENNVAASDLQARKDLSGFYETEDPFADDAGFTVWMAQTFPGFSASSLFGTALSSQAKAVWDAWANRFYAQSTLTDAQLQAIASREPNEAAFAQVTTAALHNGSYDDEFDGRITSRYLYRVQAVFPNGLRGPLSDAGLPVRLHDVVSPRAPAITTISLGDRSATLAWTLSPDTDIDHYEVYRGQGPVVPGFMDIRRMTPVPNLTPDQTSVSDSGLIPSREYFYVVVAVDGSGNKSQPSQPRGVRAVSLAGPPAPALSAARNAGGGVDLEWVGAEEASRAQIERRSAGSGVLVPITGWLTTGVATYADETAPSAALDYRVTLLDSGGNTSQSNLAMVPPELNAI